jgi:RNA polymerase sigma-70 factor (sigma-E family)
MATSAALAGSETLLRAGRRTGDPGGLDDFTRSNYARLVRYAYLLTGDQGHAEDIVQEALIRLHRHWDTVRDPYSYVRVTIANLVVDRYRAAAVRPKEVAIQHRDDVLLDPMTVLADREVLRDLLATLPSQQRAVLVLRFLEGLSVRDTAAALNCSDGTVKSHTARALHAMRERLEPPSLPEPPTPRTL